MSSVTTKRFTTAFTAGGLAGFAAVVAGGVGFAMLLLLVRGKWPPLEDLDHDIAASLNSVVAAHHWLQVVLKTITTLGNSVVLWCVVLVVAAGLLVRRRARLAAYLVITGVGALVMGPSLKLFVGRLRPVVEHTVALAPGNSFPSGHALGSTVCYGAIALVFLPAVRHRRALIGAVLGLVLLIGFSRIALGVHFLSDVLGGWLLGAVWLAVTARAFEAWRVHAGRRPTAPLSEGLEPEAAQDVRPAPKSDPAPTALWWRVTAGLAVAWVITFGLVLGLGQLVTGGKGGDKGNVLGDRAIPEWFAAHRTHTLTGFSAVASQVGATPTIIGVAVLVIVAILALTRLWRPALFIAVTLVGEVLMFLAVVAIVDRPRPEVPRLDPHLPTSSYPSGHLAATLCLYGSTAVLALAATKKWWRWLVVAIAVAAPIVVAWGRLYRGMHHPTDLLGSVILAACWVTATYLLIRPARPVPTP